MAFEALSRIYALPVGSSSGDALSVRTQSNTALSRRETLLMARIGQLQPLRDDIQSTAAASFGIRGCM